MVLQNPAAALNPVLTGGYQVREAIARRWRLNGRPVRRRVAELLVRVRLPERIISSYPHQISGGMQQRLLLSLGLALEPRLLIADEPAKGLDWPLRAQVVELLQEMTFGRRTFILITHDLPAARQLADRVAVLYAARWWNTARRRPFFPRRVILRARVLAVRELKEAHEPGAPDTRRYAVEVDLRLRKVIAMEGGSGGVFPK